LNFIDDENDAFEKGIKSFNLKDNEFSWKGMDEFYAEMTGLNSSVLNRPKRALPQYYATMTTCTNYPASKSWVTEGKVQAIKNQGSCGSCYIFASLAVMESAVAITYGTSPLSYSEQQSLDCISNECNGGWHTNVWPRTKTSGGLVQTASYAPYKASKGTTCNNNLAKDSRAIMEEWYQVPEGNEKNVFCVLNTRGPLWVAMHAGGVKFMNLGPHGVYDDPDGDCKGKEVNHAVVLVGMFYFM
jgi:C1A family cysteine protease